MADPKIGTGKKPKGSGRRLYTDENPKDTVSIKFATPTDARKTVAKVKKISKPFARKIQILTVGEQRAKVMGKSKVAAIFKKGKESIRNARSVKKRYEAQIAESIATLNIYTKSSVGIGEHPQHLDEMDKLLQVIVDAEEKIKVIERWVK